MIVCPEIKQKQPQERKTILERLSLPVAKILSPVARQAPTKLSGPLKGPGNTAEMGVMEQRDASKAYRRGADPGRFGLPTVSQLSATLSQLVANN